MTSTVGGFIGVLVVLLVKLRRLMKTNGGAVIYCVHQRLHPAHHSGTAQEQDTWQLLPVKVSLCENTDIFVFHLSLLMLQYFWDFLTTFPLRPDWSDSSVSRDGSNEDGSPVWAGVLTAPSLPLHALSGYSM